MCTCTGEPNGFAPDSRRTRAFDTAFTIAATDITVSDEWTDPANR